MKENNLTNRPIEKKRYSLLLDESSSKIVEIDVHKGETEGLCIAKVRFENAKEANSFEPPYWFGEDITNVLCLRSKYLAVTPEKLLPNVIERYFFDVEAMQSKKVKQL